MSTHPFDLAAAAYSEMVRQGFHPDFLPGSDEQIKQIRAAGPPQSAAGDVRDLRDLLWSSSGQMTM